MALVFPHATIRQDLFGDIENYCTGDFFGDGFQYLASVKYMRFIEFYYFPEFNTKVRMIEVFDEDAAEVILALHSYLGPSGHSNVMIQYEGDNSKGWKCFNGEEIIPMFREDRRLTLPVHNLAPGMYTENKRVWKNNDIALSIEYCNIKLLDESTCAVPRYPNDTTILDIIDINSGKVTSLWNFGKYTTVHDVFFVSTYDRSKILLYLGEPIRWLVLDISRPVAKNVTDQFSVQSEIRMHEPTFKYYDSDTGFPVFYCENLGCDGCSIQVYNGNGFSCLKTEVFTEPVGEYLFKGSSIYKIHIGSTGEISLIYLTHMVNPLSVQKSIRDLAGTAYISENGVFRESLAFQNCDVLSDASVESIEEIFWVGKDLLLLSGALTSTVVSLQSASEVESWYTCDSTRFACEQFQVCGTTIYTSKKSGPLPSPDASMFAKNGDNLVVATPSKIAIVSQDLDVLRIINDTCFSVFDDGYVCPTGVVFFDTPELNILAEDIVQAHMIDGQVFTISSTGELREGLNQIKVDLLFEYVSFMYSFGDTTVIFDQNDAYIYSQGEYTSIAADADEMFMLSSDHKLGAFLRHGVVYLKANVGFQMTRKRVGGLVNYSDASVYNDKLMCRVLNNDASKDFMMVKYISGKIIKTFKASDRMYECQLVSDEHFIITLMGETVGVLLYGLSEPGFKLSHITYKDTLGWSPQWRAMPNQPGYFYFAYFGQGPCRQGVFKLEDGVLSECEVEAYPTDELASEVVLPVKIGWRPSDHTGSDSHWILREFVDEDSVGPDTQTLRLIPQSQNHRDVSENSLGFALSVDPKLRCIPAKNKPDTFYAVDLKLIRNGVFKMTASGVQERISKLVMVSDSILPTKNQHRRVKYEPDFIISDGDFATVTLLPEDEADKLKGLQSELLGDSDDMLVSEIDGRFLLAATINPEYDPVFVKHGVDRNTLNKDLWDLLK